MYYLEVEAFEAKRLDKEIAGKYPEGSDEQEAWLSLYGYTKSIIRMIKFHKMDFQCLFNLIKQNNETYDQLVKLERQKYGRKAPMAEMIEYRLRRLLEKLEQITMSDKTTYKVLMKYIELRNRLLERILKRNLTEPPPKKPKHHLKKHHPKRNHPKKHVRVDGNDERN